MKEKTAPDRDALEKISSATGCSIDWLQSGAGNKYKETSSVEDEPGIAGAASPNEVSRLLQDLQAEHMGDVDSYDNVEPFALGDAKTLPVVGLSPAGEAQVAEDGGFPPDIADDYVYSDQKGRNLFALRLKGEPMEPKFESGDVIVVNPNIHPSSGDYVVAKIAGENMATFKKLLVVGESIVLQSINPKFEDQVYQRDEVELIGKVVERKTIL